MKTLCIFLVALLSTAAFGDRNLNNVAKEAIQKPLDKNFWKQGSPAGLSIDKPNPENYRDMRLGTFVGENIEAVKNVDYRKSKFTYCYLGSRTVMPYNSPSAYMFDGTQNISIGNSHPIEHHELEGTVSFVTLLKENPAKAIVEFKSSAAADCKNGYYLVDTNFLKIWQGYQSEKARRVAAKAKAEAEVKQKLQQTSDASTRADLKIEQDIRKSVKDLK